MKYSLKKKPQSSLEITMNFDENELDTHKNKAIKDISNNVTVKGFRKGKAPKDKVIQEVGEGYIMQKAIDVALQEGMLEVVTKENARVIGQPQVDIKKLTPLELVVIVDVMPELKAVDVKKMKVKLNVILKTTLLHKNDIFLFQ